MYELKYQAFAPQTLATFSSHAEAMKAQRHLKGIYPDAKIWVTAVVPINSFEDFMSITGGRIEAYDKYK
jgi:hypothetical protein